MFKSRRSSIVGQRWAVRIVALGVAAVLVVGVTVYAAGSVTTYIAQPFVVRPAKATAVTMAAEPQTPNRTAKADRAALLLDSPSYTNFSPSDIALTLSSLAASPNPPDVPGGLLSDAQIAGMRSDCGSHPSRRSTGQLWQRHCALWAANIFTPPARIKTRRGKST